MKSSSRGAGEMSWLSRLIKSTEVLEPAGYLASATLPGEVVERARLHLERAARRARALLGEAEQRGAAILEEALAGAEKIAAEARAQGFARGYEEGLARAAADGEELLERARRALESAAEERARLAEGAAAELVDLAVSIARQVLGRELLADPAAVVELARSAVSRARDEVRLRLRAHPAFTADLEAARAELLAAVAGLQELEIVADGQLSPGCVLEGRWGAVDGTVDTQLAQAGQSLRAALDAGGEVEARG